MESESDAYGREKGYVSRNLLINIFRILLKAFFMQKVAFAHKGIKQQNDTIIGKIISKRK